MRDRTENVRFQFHHRTLFGTAVRARSPSPMLFFCDGRTQWVLLSATSANVRMGNAHVGAKAARRASREIRPSQSMRLHS